jgi:hypothetical protein
MNPMNKPNCDAMKQLLMEHLYGEIADPDRDRLDSHLKTCGACREELKGFQAVRTRLQAARQLEAPVESPRVVFLGRPRRRGLVRYAQLAAAAAVILVASLGLFNARLSWTAQGPEVSLSLRPTAVGLSEADRLALEQEARLAATKLREDAATHRDILATAFREELDRRERQDAKDLEAILGSLLEDLDRRRNQDLRYLLAELGSLEMRTGREMARTNQMVEMAVLSADPSRALDR